MLSFNTFLVVLALTAASGLTWFSDQIADIPRIELGADVLANRAEPGEPQNFLLVGIDQSDGLDPDDPVNIGRNPESVLSDTIMVLRVIPETEEAHLISFPRDLWVTIAGTGGQSKINNALGIGGPETLIRTVEENFGIPIHHYVQVNFLGFRELVGILGGVPMYFPASVRDPNTGLAVDVPEGGACVTLDPVQALAFVRSRQKYQTLVDGVWETDYTGDLGRIERQQLFMRLALQRAIDRGARNPTTLRQFIDVGKDHVLLDDTLSTGDLFDLGSQFSEFDPDTLQTYELPVGGWDGGRGKCALPPRRAGAGRAERVPGSQQRGHHPRRDQGERAQRFGSARTGHVGRQRPGQSRVLGRLGVRCRLVRLRADRRSLPPGKPPAGGRSGSVPGRRAALRGGRRAGRRERGAGDGEGLHRSEERAASPGGLRGGAGRGGDDDLLDRALVAFHHVDGAADHADHDRCGSGAAARSPLLSSAVAVGTGRSRGPAPRRYALPPVSSTIAIVGAGYVGLTTGACFAHLGHDVVCADVDSEKVERLGRGDVPIVEEGLSELVGEGLRSGRLSFVLGAAEAVRDREFAYLCVPTPQGPDGRADLGYIEGAAREIARALPADSVVVNKSTVPVGSTRLVEHVMGRPDVPVVSNPEFLREGSAVHDFLHPDRIVIGADDQAAAIRVASLYLGIPAPLMVTDPASAETIKYASNAFLAAKISFVNAVAAVCEAVGADVADVVLGMGYDRRIGQEFLKPGPGFGGSCFPKDVQALIRIAEDGGYDFSLLKGVLEVNLEQFDRVVDKVVAAAGGSVQGTRIGVLGLTFKAGTDDLRDSPALAVVDRLCERGAAVRGYDPTHPTGLGSLEVVRRRVRRM